MIDKFRLEYELKNCETNETLWVVEVKPRTLKEVKERANQLITKYNWEDFTGEETPFLFTRYEIHVAKESNPVESYTIYKSPLTE
jgi:hypothetical protein